ncbi:hypothetical protein ABMA28_014038 [Loxostege sticticalis]|uniref:Tetraspanin n=1 Tax=Loxostege sticticalis TaxID=481309 RepID=A0ABD0TFB9_LOXSC
MENLKTLFKAKESKTSKHDAAHTHTEPASTSAAKRELAELTTKVKAGCCQPCFKIIFVVLGTVAILKCIAEIFVTVSTAIATRLYGSEQSGRLVGMVILALLAAVVISILIYAKIAVFRNQTKPLHTAAIVLVIVAALQAVVLGVAVRVTDQDELNLTRDLQNSFKLSRDNNPRHATIWAATQHELTCCGVNGPEDYRTSNLPDFFSPNVPISCCPSYDPDRSELVQERKRETCKAKKEYYDIGCKDLVLEAFRTSAHLLIGLTVALIVFEIILAITASIIYKKVKNQKKLRFSAAQKP